ncbi:MAG: glycosyltransferase [Parvularcula sp.]|jgi:sucrose-phosphate synthase|nr:glycosyltransferase [Parvularcula sp.]
MFILHIALQGCLRANDVEYGLTADTGGHIRYLLELVEAAEKAGVQQQEIVTRGFDEADLGLVYAQRFERLSDHARIVRLQSDSSGYLSKEEMASQLPSLADALERHILSLEDMPDIIHAHYADAGWLAAEMKARLGIPFFFTGHSLGRVKKMAMRSNVPDASIERRIEIEELAIASADRIVVSSTDEAIRQYGLYDTPSRHKIQLNPPGYDVRTFADDSGAACRPALATSIERFLTNPDKKPILALARPVRKKNLAGLVGAFGRCSQLREDCNLVIFAGTRRDIRLETDENRAVLEELLYLIDLYDLWGQVALPKDHRPSDVPGIYRYAAERGGVFCNPALNEPFGLTLIEAAAAGLPVVATHHGGPRDILANCKHGLLTDPFDEDAIAETLRTVILSPKARSRFAANGKAEVGYYSWDRHVQDYLVEVQKVAYAGRHLRRSSMPAATRHPLESKRPPQTEPLYPARPRRTGSPVWSAASSADMSRRHS